MSNLLKYLLLLILWSSLLYANIVFAANENSQMVLVSGSTPPHLTQSELRRLYLGAPVTKHGKKLVPLRNESDELLYEMFLQKVISMSASRYEQFLVKRVYRGAGSRLRVATKFKKVVALLKQRSDMVSFMWKVDAENTNGINIIQPLW